VPPLLIAAADLLARATLRFPPLERALAKATHDPALCRLTHIGAVAHSYERVLQRREIRLADLGAYRLYVNVAEPLGVQAYFFGAPCTVWFTEVLLRPGDTFVDAGANAGHYTFAAASVVGAGGRVVAVEANPEFASLIERSAGVNEFEGFVSIERRALWSKTGESMRVFLSTNPSNSGTSSLVNHGVYLSPEVGVEVTTITLDDLARERGIDRVRLLKIDVERAEDRVLEGARELLSSTRVDYLIVEMSARSAAEVALEHHGYRGYFIDRGRRCLVTLGAVPAELFGDYLFVSSDLLTSFEETYRAWLASAL
jgi:FkbM family methyltransferase